MYVNLRPWCACMHDIVHVRNELHAVLRISILLWMCVIVKFHILYFDMSVHVLALYTYMY